MKTMGKEEKQQSQRKILSLSNLMQEKVQLLPQIKDRMEVKLSMIFQTLANCRCKN